MPNWCNNYVSISHEDRSKMEALASAIKEGRFCDHVIPVPQELKDTVAGAHGDPVKQAELEAQTARNVEKYGAGNWYDFCVNRWGTKWDIDVYDQDDLEIDDYNGMGFGFDSAWSPPLGVYEELVSQGFTVNASYYEPGMGYCGIWSDGNDDYYDISGMSAKEVEDTIPADLDEGFGISECMREYEEENKDEVQVWYEDGVEKLGLEPHGKD
jgi:hypothetical protein